MRSCFIAKSLAESEFHTGRNLTGFGLRKVWFPSREGLCNRVGLIPCPTDENAVFVKGRFIGIKVTFLDTARDLGPVGIQFRYACAAL